MAAFIVTVHPVVWAGFFFVLPLAILGSLTVVGPQAAIGYVIGCACLWLMVWFSSAGFKTNYYRLSPENRTLTIKPTFDDPDTEQFAAATGTDEQTIDLTEVDSVQLIPLGPIVAARLHYRSLTVTKPEGLLIPRGQLRQIAASFRSCGVSVPELKADTAPALQRRPIRAIARITATPILIGVLPVHIVQGHLDIDVWPFLFGFVLVTWVVIIRHLTVRLGIRPTGSRIRDWLLRWGIDIFVAALGLVATLGLLTLVGPV
ncbi:hypothetical protein [Halorubrum distributum]|uniref:Uncharacterized protein n=1 Tax=Halorubrum distributum JCM 10247 TaxID=1227486 RepID=M0DTK9_9EURY|nr:hypothetical protein [Halorubrum terrestre]ELZ38183.1 hypothetical protein C473_00397 [Halorubrum terrestre JCM 10247]